MAVTRIKNNQITDSSAGNVYLGINAGTKLQDYSITAGKIANSLTYGSDLTITGNLTVNGQTTTIDTVSTVIEDPVIVLASNQTGTPAVDIGFIGERGSSDNIAFVWDESADEFVTAFTTDLVTNTTVTISSYANFHTNDANIGGNLVINGTTSLVGNIISAVNVTGNLTGGNLLTPGVVTATGNITGGNLSAGSGIISTTGNIDGGNLNATAGITAGTTIDATGNITGGNITTTGLLTTGPMDVTGNVTMTGNINLTGNINATGNLNFENVTDLVIGDPIIYLAANNVGDLEDIGFVANWDDGTYQHGGFIRDHTDGVWKIFSNVIPEPTFTVDFTNAVYDPLKIGALTVTTVSSNATVTATGNVTGGNLITAGQVVATGNVNGGNIVTLNTVTGANIIGTTSVTGGNIVISGDNITDTNGRVNFNTAGEDVDFAVNGDTRANVFYVDAGTGTASFGSATQTTGAIVAFNDPTSILMPVGNTAQRPGSGTLGMLRFNSTDDNLEIYSTAGWEAVGVPVFTVIADEQFNGDGSTVAFVLGSEQTTASCIVSINGVIQVPTVAYSVSGTGTSTLTFTEAPEPGDLIDVRQLTTTTSVTSIANTGGNAIIATDPLSATINVTGNVVPVANVAYSLGSPTNFWNELYLSGNSIYLGDIILKSNAGNLKVRNFDDTADAAVEATFISTSTTSGNLQIGLNHIEATNANGNIELRPNGTGRTWLATGNGLAIGSSANALMYMENSNVVIDNNTASGNITFRANVNGSGVTHVLKILGTGGIGLTGDLISLNANGVIANGTANIGTSTSTFNTIFAKATSAQYADLAEKYTADAEYAPGTVVVFGGDKEVTVTSVDADRAVAGVVSTNPSYIMNAGLEAEHVATVALTGRVPTRVTGTVRKGDLMVSAGYGVARAEADPRVGTVIGKALENFEGNEGVIEVVIGRF